MNDKYDKKGRLLSLLEWAELMEDMEYKRVALTELPDGKTVSTVWLGLDHSFSEAGPPIIFETMVFPKGDLGELDMERYATLEEAEAGHRLMVEKWKAKV